MSYARFLKDRLAKRQKPDFDQIARQLMRATKDLSAAEANLAIDLTWSFTIAYHAMIRAGRALMYSRGYLPTERNAHKTIVEFTRLALGNEYHGLVGRFNRMRRQRHDFIYDSKNDITHDEAKSSIQAAKRLVKRIVTLVKEVNSQMYML